jgi:uncharacterized membrane protein YagU involved in acid resistance
MAVSSLLNGALAGCIATGPMTIAMELMHRYLPWLERYPLPPSEIMTVTEEVGLRKRLNERQHIAFTYLAHFTYGITVGAVYAPLAKKIRIPSVLKGIVYALLVWVTSYLGWLPAMGILRPATEHPPRRNVLMIVAHVVYGAVLGVLVDRWENHN